MQDKKKHEQKISYKEMKELKDFYKGKSFALKVLKEFQEIALHEFMNMSSLYL